MDQRIVRFIVIFITFMVAQVSVAESDISAAQTKSNLMIVKLTHEPYESLNHAIGQMQKLEHHLIEIKDGRAVFVTTYLVILEAALELSNGNSIRDREWFHRLAVNFVNLYREALYNFEIDNNAQVPPVWKYAFTQQTNPKSSVFDCFILGLNAHIVRDMPFNLFQISPLGVTNDQRLDYNDENSMLISHVSTIVDRLNQTYGSHLGETPSQLKFFIWFASVGIKTLRADAWRDFKYLYFKKKHFGEDSISFRAQTKNIELKARFNGPLFIWMDSALDVENIGNSAVPAYP